MRRRRFEARRRMVSCRGGGVSTGAVPSEPPVDGFAARRYSGPAGESMPYRLFVPRAYDRERSYPLVVYLHGGEGRGSDNLKQISGGNTMGSHVWTGETVQAGQPAFVLGPQAPEGPTGEAPEGPGRCAPAR